MFGKCTWREDKLTLSLMVKPGMVVVLLLLAMGKKRRMCAISSETADNAWPSHAKKSLSSFATQKDQQRSTAKTRSSSIGLRQIFRHFKQRDQVQ